MFLPFTSISGLRWGLNKCFWNISYFPVVVVQLLSCVWLFAAPWIAEHQASLSLTISRSLLKLMSLELGMPSNHLILCHQLLLQDSIFPNRVFYKESTLCIRWPKFWSFGISPSNDIFLSHYNLQQLFKRTLFMMHILSFFLKNR